MKFSGRSTSLAQARAALGEWRRDYNTVRPHYRITEDVFDAVFGVFVENLCQIGPLDSDLHPTRLDCGVEHLQTYRHDSASPQTKAKANSPRWGIGRYRQSSAWVGLSPTTRNQRENMFRKVIAKSGDVPPSQITTKAIREGRERRAAPLSQSLHQGPAVILRLVRRRTTDDEQERFELADSPPKRKASFPALKLVSVTQALLVAECLSFRCAASALGVRQADPPYLLSGLDRLKPRLVLAKHGFPYMIDAGIGHGPGDFEGIQVRTIVNGQLRSGLWSNPEGVAEAEDGTKGLLDRPAYVELEKHVGVCGCAARWASRKRA